MSRSDEKARLSASPTISKQHLVLEELHRSKWLRGIFRDSAKTVNFKWKAATKSGFLKSWGSRLHKAASPPPEQARETQSVLDETAFPGTPSRDDTSEDLDEAARRGPSVPMAAVVANASMGRNCVRRSPPSQIIPLPKFAQISQPDSQVSLPEPSHDARTKPQEQQEEFSNTKVDNKVIDMVVEEGTVIDDNGSHMSIMYEKADCTGVDISNKCKGAGPEPGDNPDMVRLDIEYPSKSIFDGGEGVYFSTSHHEIVDPEMFKTAKATLDRLQPDLQPIMGSLGRKFARAGSSSHMNLVTAELRMAGEIEEGSTKITLQPSVWIICGEKSTCKAVRRRLDQLAWLSSAHYSPIYVRHGLRLACAELDLGLSGLDLNHGTPFWIDTPNGRLQRKVHVHVERSEMLPSHGALCCITITQGDDPDVLHQRLCRIGGYIIVDLPTGPQLAAITTGHGLLEYWIQQQPGDICFEDETQLKELNTASTTEETEIMATEDTGSEDETHLEESDTKTKDRFMSTEINLVEKWESATLFPGNINFVSQASPAGEGSFEVRANHIDTDFLLLSVESRTVPSSAPTMTKAKGKARATDNSHVLDASMSSAKISGMIMKSGAPQAVEIIPDVLPFFINGVMFQTKKVKLSEPTCPGLSGSWVFHNHALCGIIIAIYDGEPFALMLTAEKLFSDIEKFSSGISGVRVATELDNIDYIISYPLQKRSNDLLLTGRLTSVAETFNTIEKAPTRYSLSQPDDSKLHQVAANAIGNTTHRSRSPPSYGLFTSGRREKRIFKFARRSASWFQNGFKRLKKQEDPTGHIHKWNDNVSVKREHPEGSRVDGCMERKAAEYLPRPSATFRHIPA
ncbi:hypothetical protein F4803DRAFT_539559 [Xylaria telfairii]|nr:hypothetical protein F4803DRAFT_539559 [Xylaria telfairii]